MVDHVRSLNTRGVSAASSNRGIDPSLVATDKDAPEAVVEDYHWRMLFILLEPPTNLEAIYICTTWTNYNSVPYHIQMHAHIQSIPGRIFLPSALVEKNWPGNEGNQSREIREINMPYMVCDLVIT